MMTSAQANVEVNDRARPDGGERTEIFINRELSWLAFNNRVLEEATNTTHPVLERLRFLAISGTNWDEFYMVRVAGLKAQIEEGITTPSQDGLTPAQQLSAILAVGAELMNKQRSTWVALQRELSEQGIRVLTPKGLSADDRKWLEKWFGENVFPILTPLAVDPANPFPFIPNLGVCVFLHLAGPDGKDKYALVPVPTKVQRFVRLPGGDIRFIPLEEVIALFVNCLFPSFKLVNHGCFRVVRDSEIEIDERAEDLMLTFESALKRRHYGSVVRLSINADIDRKLYDFIVDKLGVGEQDVFMREGIVGLGDLRHLIVDDRPELLFPSFEPRFPERVRDFGGDMFAAIQAKDFIVHHPYESFDVVVQFLQQAARDDSVVAIKQTLYRTSRGSPIVAALKEAAEAGKSVTAMVELKARFDEQANIGWARDLERAGAPVAYGFVDKKVHAKISLVVRREGRVLRSYVHFGTGNYHPVTAKIYTDLSFFTCDPALCRDAARVFNVMTGHDRPQALEKLAIAPYSIRDTVIDLIEQEIVHARNGRPGGVWAKCNAIVDGKIIDALCRASQAGVQIDLIVRGICCLRPQVPGISENIRVKSIVGRFLEHSRIFAFGAGHALPSRHAKVFLSSADWMPRNLNRRIETLIPIENPTVHQQVLDEIMAANLEDKAQSWTLESDGTYTRVPVKSGALSAQVYFMKNPSLSGRGSALKKSRGKKVKGSPSQPD
jgi:polyphosphate kinase